MRKINYGLIISDFDGTLLRSDDTVAPETIKAIEEYIANGGKFGICTGRMLYSILPRANELGLKGLISAFQGSAIADIETQKLIVDAGISPEETFEICKTLEKEDLHVHLYDEKNFYVNKVDEHLRYYEKASGVKGIVLQEKLSEYILNNPFTAKKVLVVVNPKEKMEIFERIQKALGKKYCVTYSSERLIEILHPAYNKGTAVQFMADYYGVPIEKTIAIGDNLNDLPMLKAAGLGFAVKNADFALKAEVRSLAYSNDENAVGRIIEEYGYTKEEV